MKVSGNDGASQLTLFMEHQDVELSISPAGTSLSRPQHVSPHLILLLDVTRILLLDVTRSTEDSTVVRRSSYPHHQSGGHPQALHNYTSFILRRKPLSFMNLNATGNGGSQVAHRRAVIDSPLAHTARRSQLVEAGVQRWDLSLQSLAGPHLRDEV